MKDLIRRVDALIAASGVPWRRTGHSIEVRLGRSKRKQVVHLEERHDFYVFRSVVQRAAPRTRPRHLRDLAFRCWRRNARKALVTFTVDPRGSVVGRIEQPKATLDHEELRLYVEVLAEECDRFEFVLCGRDAE